MSKDQKTEFIKYKYIQNVKSRHTTFHKRKKGLFKKAKELYVLTNADILIIIYNESRHVYSYSTDDMIEFEEKVCNDIFNIK